MCSGSWRNWHRVDDDCGLLNVDCRRSSEGRDASTIDARHSTFEYEMRIGRVIGRLTLSPIYDTLVGGRFLIVEVQDRFSLAGKPRKTKEALVVYDHFGAGEGDLIAFTESREATMPFYP